MSIIIKTDKSKTNVSVRQEILEKDTLLLLSGLTLGVVGGLLATILDRYFNKYGFIYEFVVAVLFFGTVWFFWKNFLKRK